MSGQRRWWSGHELYGNRPEKYRFRENVYQDYSYIDLSPQNKEEMELDYWKSIYPEKVKKIQNRIEERCEEMEYRDSPMYDEYPDRVYLQMLGNRIYNELEDKEKWMRDMVDVLLFQEMHRRRCKRGMYRHWYGIS